LMFAGKPALEIGCFLGWSACHLALGGVLLDVVDPILRDPGYLQSVTTSLQSAGVMDRVKLHAGPSPSAVKELAAQQTTTTPDGASRKWELVFIDGNHEFPGPVNDAVVCERYCAESSMVLFHDLMSPHVAEGLQFFRYRGWKTRIFHTSQIMGVAWRGDVQPVNHIPDPSANWDIPEHLRGWPQSE